MKQVINKLFTFLSYGVLNGSGVRIRTRLVFTQFVLINTLTVQFFVLYLFSASNIVVGITLLVSTFYYKIISFYLSKYTNSNWKLFSPQAKDQIGNLWAYRILVYSIIISSLILLILAGYWWGKDNTRQNRAQTSHQLVQHVAF